MPVVIVTGATKGIGRAIAEKFIKGGFDLAVCARNIMDLKEMKNQLENDYPDRRVLIRSVDVKEQVELQNFAEEVLQQFEEIEVLVNNAGLFVPGSILDEADGDLELMVNTNLYSAYHLTRLLVPQMVKQQAGHIFNLSSIAATQAYPNGGSYSISKYALSGFSENLRYELRNQGIKVTNLIPGAVYTDSWAGSGISEERLMKPSDVADMVWAAYHLSSNTMVEEIVFRPQRGDL